MNFEEYQKAAKEKAVYPTLGHPVVFPTLGMLGEAGEVSEKIKKIFRDHDSEITESTREEIKKELGDVLWYMSQIASELDINLQEIAEFNLEKITSRHERGAVWGEGDNR